MGRGFRNFRREPGSADMTLVTYNVDVGVSYTEKVAYGKTVLSPKSFTPTKSGYTFLGWRLDSTASTSVLSDKVAETDTLSLYAVFTTTVTLSYNGNGSTSGSTASQTGTKVYNNNNVVNPSVTLRSNGYARTNYTFVAWAAGGSSGTQYKPGASYTIANNITMYAYWVATSSLNKTFNYTGGVQSYSVLATGTYQLEVYGAQGGTGGENKKAAGGKGGYSKGNVSLTAGSTIYVVVGGAGTTAPYEGTANGGYNGGGSCYGYFDNQGGGSGGGATHIGKSNAILSKTAVGNLYIVAGGGGGGGGVGGSQGPAPGGTGGGTNGGNGSPGGNTEPHRYGTGGTQTAGGYGIIDNNYKGSYGQGGGTFVGGGGGYYGGGGSSEHGGWGGGGGGSGYIGGVTGGSMSNGQRSGNGMAKITFVS